MKKVTPQPIFGRDMPDSVLRLCREYSEALNQLADHRFSEFVQVSASYTAGENDHVIECSPSVAMTVTLPAASVMRNKRVVVKRANNTTHTITIQSTAGNIDDAASVTLTTAYQSREVFSDGSNWWLLDVGSVCSASLAEIFDGGLSGYTVTSGNGALFTVATDTYGETLTCASQNTSPSAVISRIFAVCEAKEVLFKFCITTSNSDDAAIVTFSGGLGSFIPRREAAFDSARRPTMRGVALGTTGLDIGDWYQAHIYYSGSDLWISLENLTDATPAVDYLVASSLAVFPVTHLVFTIDQGGPTCPVKYADIYATS